nr:FixH family protein [Thiohalobacter thiocyanaticus]
MEQLITIPLGIVLQVVLFIALRCFAGMAAKSAAAVIGLLALGIYLPYAILTWPGGDVVAMHVALYAVTAYGLGLIVANREARLRQHGGSEGWFHWGPAIIIGFFVFLILFDTAFVVISQKGLPEPVAEWLLPRKEAGESITTNFPGVAARDYQEKQSHFNRFLEQHREQTERGWQVSKGWLGTAVAGRPSRFQVQVLDRAGQPVTGAGITGSFPASGRHPPGPGLRDAGDLPGPVPCRAGAAGGWCVDPGSDHPQG